ncbi:MAG: sensor domain-containing protein [Leifsonia flava]
MSTDTAATAVATPTPSARPSRWAGYGSLWRRVPQELGFLLLTMPIAIIGLSIVAPLFWTGIGSLVLVFGIFIVIASLYVSRGFGVLELVRLRWSGRPAIKQPLWRPRTDGAGFWGTFIFGPVADGHYWLYLLHTMIISPIISIVSWTVTVVWVSIGLGGISFWIWARYIPMGDREFWVHDVVLDWMFPGNTWQFDSMTGEIVFEFILGVLFLITLPFVTRSLTLMHQGVARGLLGGWRSEELRREVADLSASRGAAVAAEDRSLRRLERDIHDGPQQRLVRLQMDLAAAERRLDTDPEAAKTLLAEARLQAHDTLEELRALSRGFAPPILQDRGLVSALDSLATRSPVPVRLESTLGTELRLPGEIERSAYFVAAELVTNAVKHAGATSIRLVISTRGDSVTDADSGAGSVAAAAASVPRWLDLWVIDDGIGGAATVDGHGLSGLEERLTGLRGVLVIDSPVGGPTTIGAHIPLPGEAAALS